MNNLYITFRETNEEGETLYFILQKEFPHYQTVVSEVPKKVFVECVPVTDYNLYITFAGVISGFMIPSYHDVEKEISSVMASMALWFYSERILVNPKKYKKWKI